MGWDYWTYRRQPIFYRDEVWAHYLEEQSAQSEQADRVVDPVENAEAWAELRRQAQVQEW